MQEKIKKYKSLRIFGVITMIHGAFFCLASIFALFSSQNIGEVAGVLIFFGILPLTIGWYIFKKNKFKESEALTETIEMQILQVASQKKGQLNATELALLLNISVDKSTENLQMMSAKGICFADVNENGSVIYTFRDLLAK